MVHSTVGPSLTMADLVGMTGVAPSTVRYYISTGLVPPGLHVASNRFLYDERHVEALRLIVVLKERRKLSLEEIRRILPELLQLPEGGAFRPAMWDQLVEARALATARTAPAARLLESGIELFTRRGYAEVRVDDVCRAAGLAKGSFYRYFASKEELFFAAAREVGVRVADRFASAVSADPPASADAATQALVAAVEPNLGLLLDLMALAAQRKPGYGRVLREVVGNLHRLLQAGEEQAPGRLPDDALERAVVGALQRLVLSPLAERDRIAGDVSG